jgi:uncharacterized protein YcfJ
MARTMILGALVLALAGGSVAQAQSLPARPEATSVVHAARPLDLKLRGELGPLSAEHQQTVRQKRQAPVSKRKRLVGAAIGLLVGAAAGAFIGWKLDADSGADFPGPLGAIKGAAIGAPIGALLGAVAVR